MSQDYLESERATVEPHWTLGQLKETFPGVELALYAHFGVGSRERSGFAASERLDDLLRRHLIFDAKKACSRLDALAAEDWTHQITSSQLHKQLAHTVVIDARSRQEYERGHIFGSQLLSASAVTALRAAPDQDIVVVCSDGSQSPSASRHLRSLGLLAKHLTGGLVSWSITSDESFPINYPLHEIPGRWHLLADGNTLRYRRVQPVSSDWRIWSREQMSAEPVFRPLLEASPKLELIAVTPRSFSVRGLPIELSTAISPVIPFLSMTALWNSGGDRSDETGEQGLLARVLAEEAEKILKSHKGTVEISRYENRKLWLRLGGGCAGCASAQITTQRELAAALYREVPLLDSISSETE